MKKFKSKNFDKIKERLDWLWFNAPHPIHKGGHNIKSNEEKICNITFEKRGNLDLYFISFDRWSDNTIFEQVVNGKFIPNDIGLKINLVYSGDFGSANLVFIANDKSLKLAIETLQLFGYEVGFSNIEE